MGQFCRPVRNPAQPDQGQIEMLARTQDGKGFHVDHLGVGRIIARSGDHTGPRRKRRCGQAGHLGQGDARRQIQQRRLPLWEPQRRCVHIAIFDRLDLIDLHLRQYP